MAVLRDTRAKIDPQFLAAMKERFSGLMPAEHQTAAPPARPAPSGFSGALEEANKKQAKEAVYPPNTFEVKTPAQIAESKTEAVDKQKIAQIVLQYMKNREEKSKH
jgi:hypothetical protein